MNKRELNIPNAQTILRKPLANGATLMAWQNGTSPAVSVQGIFYPGAIADTPGNYGLTAFSTAMLMTGTKKDDFQSLHEKIESLGASINIRTGRLTSNFSVYCLSEDLPVILDLLTDILTQPIFPEDHFHRIKAQALTSLAILAQNTGAMAKEAFSRLLYGEHPFAHPNIGYAKDINAITLDDLYNFHQSHFTPQGMIISAVGGLDPNTMADIIENNLGTWQNTTTKEPASIPDFQAPSTPQREHVTLEEKSQTDLIVGVLAPPRKSLDYRIATLGNHILGQFGMMGRIGESVREKAGLAYYVQSDLTGGLGPSSWEISAGVNPNNLDKAISLIKEELKRFVNEPVLATELEDSRSQLIGLLPLSLETNVSISHTLLNIERYQQDLNYLIKFPTILKSISVQDILEVAQRYWQFDRLIVTSAGRAIS